MSSDRSLEEPAELRDKMRELAAVAPHEARSRLSHEIAVLLTAEATAPALVPDASGVDVEAVCAAYARELWLWLVGERTWEQCVGGLRGRLLRRVVART